ncbi:MAG: DUF6029 family protein [Saprospiraceae bacterium]|nr:DUF6029 family protein [Saprospiraceae bacterium]
MRKILSINWSKLILIISLLPLFSFGQDILSSGQVHGNFQLDAQYYLEDSTIGAPEVPEKMGMNAFANIIYTNKNFEAGVRYESYLNPLQGYDTRYKGNGFAYRYAKYTNDDFEITVGNFYEQFGTGLIFRAYEERNLGYDNAVDGIRVKYNPFKGVTVKGIAGYQRNFWEKSEGIIRGIDGEIFINDLVKKYQDSKTRVTIGGSFISKFQSDQDPLYKLPENVGCYGGRLSVSRGKINVYSEYAYKINDPSGVNGFIYKPGESLLIETSYSPKGLGVSLAVKRVDNMNYRTDRAATGSSLNINYLPALTKLHTYSLSAIYPYATQPNGEMGLSGTINYKFKKDTKIGGKYGTAVALNYSRVNSIDKTAIDSLTPIGQKGTLGYESEFFKIGDRKYYEDFNIEITKKFNKKIKGVFSWVNMMYNIDVNQGHAGQPDVYANIAIADVSYRLKDRNSVRLELQHLSTHQDERNWALALVEYSTKHWFFALMDQYNYGNDDSEKQIHYYTASVGYNKNTSRIALSYGKQREGILCVGGVCRAVPAANGLTLTLTSSF